MAKYNPFTRSFQEDPYSHYRAIRAEEPVHRAFFGMWVVTRYSDIVAVLKDRSFHAIDVSDERMRKGRKFSRADGAPRDALLQTFGSAMIMKDPPDHTRIRRLVQMAFAPREIQKMRPWIEEAVSRRIETARASGTMDVVDDLAAPLPVQVIARMMAIPEEHWEQLRLWTEAFTASFMPLPTTAQLELAEDAAKHMRRFFAELRDQRLSRGGDDVMMSLIRAREDDASLTEEELISNCILLFNAGHETTRGLIANGTFALLCNPEQAERVRSASRPTPNLTDELLRYDTSVQSVFRVASEDRVLGDRTIRAGDQVCLVLGAGNRDPERFADPDQLDIERTDVQHLAFGMGVHYCLGAALGKLEGDITVRALMNSGITLDPERPAVWGDNSAIRSLRTLPVRFT